jgi:hypothetical protein
LREQDLGEFFKTGSLLFVVLDMLEEKCLVRFSNLTVAVVPQPEGGVQIKFRGNDREGMQARQSEWIEWSEGLPKKPEVGSDTPTDDRSGVDSPEVDLPPPPTVESPNLPVPVPAASVPVPPPQPPPSTTAPPPQRQGSTVW